MRRLLFTLLIALIGMSDILAGDRSISRGVVTPMDDSSSNVIDIVFGGEPGTRFVATLKIHRENGVEKHELAETVPSEHRYRGEALEASVRQLTEGDLTVEVRKGGNVSRSSSRGENSQLSLQIR